MESPQVPSTRLLACAGVGLVLSYGIYSVAVRLWADTLARDRTLTEVERAIRLAGGNGEYWLIRAELLDASGADPAPALRHAAQLDPGSAETWTRLGLVAERRNDLVEAKRDLLQAASVSSRYEPRWNLANFYFRRAEPSEFWRWTRLALQLTPRNPDALFRLCWRMSQDANEVVSKALPQNRQILRNYLRFLLEDQHIEAAEPIAARICRDAQTDDRDLLLAACDRFLQNGRVQSAVDTWNGLCDKHVLSYRRLDPAHGVSLTNGEFKLPEVTSGFDWRTATVPGVTAVMRSGLATVYYSGKQPEECESTWQYVPVLPEKHYVLRFTYKSSIQQPEHVGPRWLVRAVDPNSSLLGASNQLLAAIFQQEAISFRVPKGISLVRLGLVYSREPGTVRIEGSVSMRAMEMFSLQ